MIEFFQKNLFFFILVTVLFAYIMYDFRASRKKEKRDPPDNTKKEDVESQKKER